MEHIETKDRQLSYRVIYWSTRKKGHRWEPYGKQDFPIKGPDEDKRPLCDDPNSEAMSDEGLQAFVKRLSDDPTIYKLEIWRRELIGGFERGAPGAKES